MAIPVNNNDNQMLINLAKDQPDYNVDDPYRTAYHFQPTRYWMNDPNGPMIYKGIYHFFYQHNPDGTFWKHELVWGHSTSTDLINWTTQPIALIPSEPYDIRGCWSGSVTILPGDKPAILYTGIDTQGYQVQNLALPKDLSDPYLKEWVKAPENPIIVGSPNTNDLDPFNLRDPSTAWLLPDGKWRIVIGTQHRKNGLAALYTSDDFVTWTVVDHPLRSVVDSGMWECPDFFPVYVGKSIGADTSVIGDDVKHVFKVSLIDGKKELYTIGRYDIGKDIYVPDEGSIENGSGLMCDYGRIFASKSFFDSKTNRRILFGWSRETSSAEANNLKGWAGLQGIPRTMVLDEFDKQLVQWPITEVETLRYGQVDFPSQIVKGGSVVEISGITGSQADVEVSFEIPELKDAEIMDPTWTNPRTLCEEKGVSVNGTIGPFGLLTLATTGLEEYTAIFFRVFKDPNASNKYVVLMGNDLSRSSQNPTTTKPSYGTFVDVNPAKEELSLRALIDHSIVESFGSMGKNCITARVYPKLAINDKAKLYLFNYGTEDVRITKLSAWSMKKAQVNLPIDINENN